MRTRRVAVPVLTALITLTAACSGSSAAPPKVAGPAPDLSAGASGHHARFANWPMYHGSLDRHGYAATMPRVKGHLKVVRTLKLDGQVYASPIVVHGTTVVATEHNTVYAFGPKFHLLWKKHLGAPSPQNQRPCGDIDPLGITGTPVYDGHTHSVYVAPEIGGSPPHHQLVALNLANGHIRWRRTLDFPGVDRATMQERGALTITSGRVYVPFGGLAGDCGNYKGRVVGRLATTGGKPVRYTVPTAREAGIWTPPGPTVDAAGQLLVAVGNGASGVGDKYDHSDSVLKLAPSLKLLQSFSPKTWPTDNDNDLDLGSQGPAVVGKKWIFQAGKSGTVYVVRQHHLGGIGGAVHSAKICASYGGTAVHAGVVYVPCTDGVRAVRIGAKGRPHVLWHATSSAYGSPVIGGGRIWTVDPDSGTLYGLGPAHGRVLQHADVGTTSRFATPAIYGRYVLVPTLSGLTVVATS